MKSRSKSSHPNRAQNNLVIFYYYYFYIGSGLNFKTSTNDDDRECK